MSTIRETLFLAIAILLAAVGTHYGHPRAPAWYEVEAPLAEDELTLEQIDTRWKGDVLWIDARPRQLFEAAHIPGAILLNEQEADTLMFDYFEKLQDNSKPVVIYCDSSACQASRKMKQYLKERLPIEEIYILKGGWEAWQSGQKSN